MKIKSRVGISKLTSVGFGLFVVIFGMTTCYNQKAIGVYRRGSGPSKHINEARKHLKTARDSAFSYKENLKHGDKSRDMQLDDIDEDYTNSIYSDDPDDWKSHDVDTEITENPPSYDAEGRMAEEEANERLQNISDAKNLPVGSREAVYADIDSLVGVFTEVNVILGHFYFVSVWTAIVLVVFFSSILNLSLTLGDPQPPAKYFKCFKYLDYASNLCSVILLLIVGVGLAVLVSAAVNRKRDHVKNHILLQTNASDHANLQDWKNHLTEAYVDPEDVEKSYVEISKKGHKTPRQISGEMFEKYEKEIMRLYKDQMNFELQVTTAVVTIVYAAVLLVTFVMLCLDKTPPMQSNLPMMQPSDSYGYYYGPYGGSKQPYQQGPGGSMIGIRFEESQSSQDGEGSDEDIEVSPEVSEDPFTPPDGPQKKD